MQDIVNLAITVFPYRKAVICISGENVVEYTTAMNICTEIMKVEEKKYEYYF